MCGRGHLFSVSGESATIHSSLDEKTIAEESRILMITKGKVPV